MLAACLDAVKILDAGNVISKRYSDASVLTILAYHRVVDIDPSAYPFDEELVSASVAGFDEQTRFVKDNFDAITFADLDACLVAGRLPRRPMIITFDDGYRDNYTHAFPILKKWGLPATIFLTSGHIGTNEPFWFEKVAYWIKKTEARSLKLVSDGRVYEYALGKDRGRVIKDVQDLIKSVDENTHKNLISSLEHEAGVEIGSTDEVMPLSWKEVLEMSASGMEFGAHSATHINMAAQADGILQREVFSSKHAIERRIKKPVTVFSYPFGGGKAFSKRTEECIRDAGFKFAVSYVDGINSIADLKRFEMKRVCIERYDSFALFKGRVSLRKVFGR